MTAGSHADFAESLSCGLIGQEVPVEPDPCEQAERVYQKFKCENKKCGRKWYVNAEIFPPYVRCSCGEKAPAYDRPHKSVPTGGYNPWSESIERRLERGPRAAADKATANWASYVAEDSGGSEMEVEWEPTARNYNLNMRYTKANYDGSWTVASPGPSTGTRDTGWVGIGAVRDRPHSPASVMARAISRTPGSLRAWSFGGFPKYDRTNDRHKESAEWCHLIADSLGGDTAATNLVAASFGANTFMAALEKLLKGRTDCEVRVTVRPDTATATNPAGFGFYLARGFYYEVRQGSKSIGFDIDARCRTFSAADALLRQGQLHAVIGPAPP